VIKFKGGHSEKIPTPTIDKEPKIKQAMPVLKQIKESPKEEDSL